MDKRIVTKLVAAASLLAVAVLSIAGCFQSSAPTPIACIQADPTIGYAPLTVAFDASCSFVPAGAEDVYHFRWEFDDGTDEGTGLARTTTHTFEKPGTYAVYVVMINSAYEWVDSATRVVTVLPAD